MRPTPHRIDVTYAWRPEMKRSAFVITSFCLTAVLTWIIIAANAAEPVAARHQRWEYIIVPRDELAMEAKMPAAIPTMNPKPFENVLNAKYGSIGWEMCGLDQNGFVFKRRLD